MARMYDGDRSGKLTIDNSDAANCDVKLPNGNGIGVVAFDELTRFIGVDLRRLPAPADLTADEIATVRLERELEKAVADDVIEGVASDLVCSKGCFAAYVHHDGRAEQCLGGTRIDALKKVAELVRTRRAEQADAQAIAAAEARLFKAHEDGKIEKPEGPQEKYDALRPSAGKQWRYQLIAAQESKHLHTGWHSSRLTAATEAANWAEALPAKPTLPDVESMDETAKVVEIIKRGYEVRPHYGLPALYKGDDRVMFFSGKPYTLSNALAEARRRDALAAATGPHSTDSRTVYQFCAERGGENGKQRLATVTQYAAGEPHEPAGSGARSSQSDGRGAIRGGAGVAQ